MIQTLVVDDEPLARRKLRELLRDDPDVNVIGEAANGSELFELLRQTSPHVMFLDVCMPGKDAFEVLEHISQDKTMVMPQVILTTGYDQYAFRAFDARVCDYLLKPFTAERLRSAVQRVKERLSPASLSAGNFTPVETRKKEPLTRVVFKSRGRILFLQVSEIRWITAEENYIRISNGSESYLLRETISSMEARLDPRMFLRVHRSAIVNLDYVKEIRTDAKDDFVVHLVSGQKIPMSRGYRSRVRHRLSDWLLPSRSR